MREERPGGLLFQAVGELRGYGGGDACQPSTLYWCMEKTSRGIWRRIGAFEFEGNTCC